MAVGRRLSRRLLQEALGSVLGSGKGIPYSNSNTAVNDNPRRLETSPLKLRDIVIKVSDNGQLIGGGGAQHCELAAAGSIGISFLDLSLFYFRNVTAGQNGTVQVFGTRL